MNSNRTAVISGGLGGVGRAVAKQLAEDGLDVVLLYLATPKGEAESFLKTLAPGKHAAIKCDIRDEHAVAKTVQAIADENGGIQVCVHAATDPIIRKNILELTGAELEEQLKTALFGGFNLIKDMVQCMKNAGAGKIICVLSRVINIKDDEISHPRMAGYVIAKHALRGMLHELYLELTGGEITVNAIAPDFLDTKLNADLPDKIRMFIKERAITGSIRSPEDVARLISYLVSDKGDSINGKIYSFNEKELRDL